MSTAPDYAQITALILAGGQGRRMGGADKGLLPLAGRPLIAHVLDRLTDFDHVVISANRNLEAYAAFGRPVLRDGLAGHPGPLAGILAALEIIETPWLLTVPVDAPRLPGCYAGRMWEAIPEPSGQAAVASDGERIQPVFSLLAKGLADDLRRYLGAGERRASAWLRRIGAHEADFPDHPRMFLNLNTPEALAALEREWEMRT